MSAAPAAHEPIARTVRQLPGAPSLEYERKAAKALLRKLRAGDPDALRRVQSAHPAALRGRAASELKLADVQHAIAREYGFTSWPRLVEYFEEMERHRNAPRLNSSDDLAGHFDEFVRSAIKRHERGDPFTARELAHFVPRFYRRPLAEILATPITEDDARLLLARENRRVSWEELTTRAEASREQKNRELWEAPDAPWRRALQAMRDNDVAALAALLDEHPALLNPSVIDREWNRTLGSMAIGVEQTSRSPDARRISELLESRGIDVQTELNRHLLGHPMDRGNPERVRWYLERGADPNWMPPNGIPVLEHALVRFKDAGCVDLIAARVTPRRALWIAAGLGDVAGVRSFLAGNGRLTPEGRLNRPDQMAMGWFVGLPPNLEADDLEIMWEAFQIAGWNRRWAAMDALLEGGLPIDHAPMVFPLLLEAVGNMMLPLAEYLVSRGADLDREIPGHGSARSMARSHLEGQPDDAAARRLFMICGAGDPAEVAGAVEAKVPSPPPPAERTMRALRLAADDAARQGQTSVTSENLLVGMLRVHNGVFAQVFMGTGTDMPKLRELIGARLLPDADPLLGQSLPPDPDGEAAVRAAAAEAERRRRFEVSPGHLLHGILAHPESLGAKVLAAAGATAQTLRGRLEHIL